MESAKKILNKYLNQEGIRRSRQRDKVLEVFLNSERHLTAGELYELTRKKYPEIGYATIYRALKIINEAGLAEEVDFGDGAKRFEHKHNHKHHDHLVCTECGEFTEIANPQIEKLQVKIAKEHGFDLSGHKLYLFGICKRCGKERGKKQK